MQFKLSSCFVTHSESVLVECPNLNRPPAFIPPLHHSSINLAGVAALVLIALSLITQSLSSLPISLQYIYILCSISLQSFLASLEKRTVETNNFSFLP